MASKFGLVTNVVLNQSLIAVVKDLETLKNEAAEKKFPDNELLRRLSGVLKDIERCERTSSELLSAPAPG